MKFEMKPQDRAYLRLAEKVAAGIGSSKERAELEIMIKENPELRDEFAGLLKNLRDEKATEFWSVAVRVMVGTATLEEVKQIEALKASDPKRWGKYQDALEFMHAMVSRHDSFKSRKVEPMPQRVRKELLRQLSLEKP